MAQNTNKYKKGRFFFFFERCVFSYLFALYCFMIPYNTIISPQFFLDLKLRSPDTLIPTQDPLRTLRKSTHSCIYRSFSSSYLGLGCCLIGFIHSEMDVEISWDKECISFLLRRDLI